MKIRKVEKVDCFLSPPEFFFFGNALEQPLPHQRSKEFQKNKQHA